LVHVPPTRSLAEALGNTKCITIGISPQTARLTVQHINL
jgi:hypothetical protein